LVALASASIVLRSSGVGASSAAGAAAPYVKNALAEKAFIDLKPFAADARKKIEAVLGDFQKHQAGVQLDAKINALRLTGIAFDAQTLRIIAEAEGSVDVAVSTLAIVPPPPGKPTGGTGHDATFFTAPGLYGQVGAMCFKSAIGTAARRARSPESMFLARRSR